MFVCSCKAVTDRDVREAVVDGASSVDDVMHRCHAGTECGGCWPTLERLIAETKGRDLATAAA